MGHLAKLTESYELISYAMYSFVNRYFVPSTGDTAMSKTHKTSVLWSLHSTGGETDNKYIDN